MAFSRRQRIHRRTGEAAPGAPYLELLESRILLADTSFPVILQWFESSYDTIENRAADVFHSGYGSIYTPPPGRADLGNFSVGYDAYDRFDLGSPGNPTMYGTEVGLKTTVDIIHRLGADYYLDYIINHNGYSTLASVDGNGNSFYDAGGYPGMVITLPNDFDGDFNGGFEWGDINGRLAGLLDIDHAKNYRFVRNPVPGFANNIRPGTEFAFGRIANVPDENNRRFYPDQSLQPIIVFDPVTGESGIQIFPFNNGNPLAGDPVEENATGYLMRNAQWLIQHIGVDGFRIDAAKHIEGFALDFYDRAVYRASFRTLLNGQQKQIFSFSEVFDGDQNYLQTFVKDNINPNDPGRVGGNRDVLDFPLFFALRDNLTGDGFANDWFDIRNATFDLHDDGMHNGSQGVQFIGSHDEHGPFLGNVAAAYMLMHPGNAVIYFNGKEFGDHRDFPKDGRGDALGGIYGDAIPELVQIRNSHGRGNYIERWIEKEIFAYEREASSVVLLSNRLDSGFDSRTIEVNFAPGTHLIELTGNASGANTDPFNDIPEVVTVFQDFDGKNKINVRFLRNSSNGNFHGNGYLIYGLPEPEAPDGLQLTNVSQVLEGELPGGGGGSLNYQNGVTRLNDLHVITADSFQARLNTVRVNLLGSPNLRDVFADGDNALIKIDGGIDVNGNGFVDYVNPNTQSYGFEEFHTKKSPLYNNPNADGQFIQTIDATKLSEGQHFIEVKAFRHRSDGGPAIFSTFKEAIYVDRLKPVSHVESFNPFTAQFQENRQLVVRSADLTADNVHVLWDLPASLTDAQVLGMIGAATQATQIDRDMFTKSALGVTHGNHVATLVTFEPTGNVNVQRMTGLFTSTIFGAGLGDLTTDGQINLPDVQFFGEVFHSNDSQFNPAADFNGDGLVNLSDHTLFGEQLAQNGADATTLAAHAAIINAPMIAQVIVASSSWSPAFVNHLLETNQAPGHAVSAGAAQLNTLSWSGINQIKLRFTENVQISPTQLSLQGVNIAETAISDFSYDAVTFTATWTLSNPLSTDNWLINLSDAIQDVNGNALDGDWTNPASTPAGDQFPSGNGSSGGDFAFRFNVLPGDVTGLPRVLIDDVIRIRNAQGQSVGMPGYITAYDLDGSGTIDASDYQAARNLQFTSLPAGEPGTSALLGTLSTSSSTTTALPLVSAAPILAAPLATTTAPTPPPSTPSASNGFGANKLASALAAHSESLRQQRHLPALPRPVTKITTSLWAQVPALWSLPLVTQPLASQLMEQPALPAALKRVHPRVTGNE